ncbi:insulinase family protein [Mesorhizobium sp.]|uniref:M16 family metallopeptidase n=1 Tax=Mesorhizobium sp. TaxID=1871066 RepID=UPI000FE78B00|nr:insulinase family protein [Mesorhizobium sp.]RWB57236.1 MAG: insulinase family protein [Mesorhizobium sp.]
MTKHFRTLIGGLRRNLFKARASTETRPKAALSNSPTGIQFLFQPSSTQQSAAIGFAFRGGIAHDPEDGPHTSLVAPRMLLESALNRTGGQISETLTDLEGTFVLNAEPEAIFGLVVGPKKSILEIIHHSREFLAMPQISERMLDDIKKLVFDQLTEHAAEPYTKAQQAFLDGLCLPHPYVRSVIPDPEMVKNITAADVVTWHSERLVKSRLIVSVVGHISEVEAGSLVDALFGRLPKGYPSRKIEGVEFKPIAPTPITVSTDTPDQAVIGIGSASVSVSQPESWLAARMLAHILAGDENARLFREVRNGTGKTYGLQYHFDFFLGASFFVLFGAIAKEDLNGTLSTIRSSIDSFVTQGPTAAEIALARTAVSALMRTVTQDHSAFARELTNLLFFGWSVDDINRADTLAAEIDLSTSRYREELISLPPLVVVAG